MPNIDVVSRNLMPENDYSISVLQNQINNCKDMVLQISESLRQDKEHVKLHTESEAKWLAKVKKLTNAINILKEANNA